MSTKPSIAVIGLGNLGAVLAGTLAAEGHPTTVWNRTAAKADGPVAKGATLAATPAEAVRASELVIVCVLDYDAAREILMPVADDLRGRVVLNLGTGTPDPARELAAWTTSRGADYLDGAVYAVPQTIATPEAFILYSGAAAAYEKYRPHLEILAVGSFVGSDPGLASVYDLALLSGMYGMFAGFFQAVALGSAAGVPAVEITGLLVRWLTAVTPALGGFAEEVDAADYRTETSNLAINAVGLANILGATEAQGLSTDLLKPLQALFDDQIAQGHGAASLARAVESLKP
ncbi:NAD(P)-dependent oxidoreductase [Spirillospora sp. CA-294931]|uniref:NAD(P)-dependent oxidoreductase n=1 Tax=Spirillospora sp. CA-294931 TaxID=3240042 RepID=UPI003D8E4066